MTKEQQKLIAEAAVKQALEAELNPSSFNYDFYIAGFKSGFIHTLENHKSFNLYAEDEVQENRPYTTVDLWQKKQSMNSRKVGCEPTRHF